MLVLHIKVTAALPGGNTLTLMKPSKSTAYVESMLSEKTQQHLHFQNRQFSCLLGSDQEAISLCDYEHAEGVEPNDRQTSRFQANATTTVTLFSVAAITGTTVGLATGLAMGATIAAAVCAGAAAAVSGVATVSTCHFCCVRGRDHQPLTAATTAAGDELREQLLVRLPNEETAAVATPTLSTPSLTMTMERSSSDSKHIAVAVATVLKPPHSTILLDQTSLSWQPKIPPHAVNHQYHNVPNGQKSNTAALVLVPRLASQQECDRMLQYANFKASARGRRQCFDPVLAENLWQRVQTALAHKDAHDDVASCFQREDGVAVGVFEQLEFVRCQEISDHCRNLHVRAFEGGVHRQGEEAKAGILLVLNSEQRGMSGSAIIFQRGDAISSERLRMLSGGDCTLLYMQVMYSKRLSSLHLNSSEEDAMLPYSLLPILRSQRRLSCSENNSDDDESHHEEKEQSDEEQSRRNSEDDSTKDASTPEAQLIVDHSARC